MIARRQALLLAAVLVQGAPRAQEAAAEPAAWLRAPALAEVAWRGMLATEAGAVGSGPQIGLYPAPSPAGLLAAILMHAAIQGGASASQRKREQEEADRVLEPYRAALQAWPAAALWQAALAAAAADLPLRLWEGQGAAPAGTLLEAAPMFTMAQDESVLLLDLAVKRSIAGQEPQQSVVRVVSSPTPLEALVAVPLPAASAASAAESAPLSRSQQWAQDDARRLKRTAAAMLAHALQLAQRHTGPDDETVPMRTHRYLQGAVTRTERARQLAHACHRVVLRTLRGTLMSVPVAAGADCQAADPF